MADDYNPWTFTDEDAKSTEFPQYELIPEGNHRVRVFDVENGTSKSSGRPMLTITFEVSGYTRKLKKYIVSDAKNTGAQLCAVMQSIGYKLPKSGKVTPLDYAKWNGRVGAAKVVHEEYNGNPQPKIAYMLTRPEDIADLPKWVEPGTPRPATSTPALSTDDTGDTSYYRPMDFTNAYPPDVGPVIPEKDYPLKLDEEVEVPF